MLVARLFDVAANGTEMEITTGPVLGSQRELDAHKSWSDSEGNVTYPWPKLDRDQYLTRDEVYRFDIAMLVRHWSIRPGHRLRLELAGQTPPALCERPGAARSRGADVCFFTPQQQATLAGGIYTLRTGPRRPSTLTLPQLPFGTVATVPSGIMPTESATAVSRRLPLPLVW